MADGGSRYWVREEKEGREDGVGRWSLGDDGDGDGGDGGSRGLRATVAPSRGGALCSLQARVSDGGGGSEWRELLYRADDFSPADESKAWGWPGHAPHLFPAVGRSFTPAQLAAAAEGEAPKVCHYEWDGETREIGTHGFLMGTGGWTAEAVDAEEAGGPALRLSLDSSTLSAAQRASYPFAFAVTATYAIRDGVLSVVMGVSNRGEEVLPFSIGNHITLQFPFTTAGSWAAGLVRSSAARELKLEEGRSIFTGVSEPRPEFVEGLSLASKTPDACNMVVAHAEGDTDGDATVELVEPGAFGVRITQNVLRGDGADALRKDRFFVFWGAEDCNFFCPEPWLGGPNSLNEKVGLAQLAAGKSMEWGFTVSIVDA